MFYVAKHFDLVENVLEVGGMSYIVVTIIVSEKLATKNALDHSLD